MGPVRSNVTSEAAGAKKSQKPLATEETLSWRPREFLKGQVEMSFQKARSNCLGAAHSVPSSRLGEIEPGFREWELSRQQSF